MEPYAIIGGNPAKTIRKRFDERTVQMLLEMKWWDWPIDQLQAVMPLMTSGNVEALYQHWQAASQSA
ncbi:hypothetical protein P308_18155 [Pseudomonas piscis]|nr:hypothetical protein P308_18155 [Pseudomonas piscis]